MRKARRERKQESERVSDRESERASERARAQGTARERASEREKESTCLDKLRTHTRMRVTIIDEQNVSILVKCLAKDTNHMCSILG